MVFARRQIRSWLEAERSGRDDEASRALSGLLRALPELSPSPGLLDNVMLAVDASVVRPLSRLFSWAGRAVVAASVVLVAAAIVSLPLLRVTWSPEVGDVLAVASGLARLSKGWLDAALSMWGFLAAVVDTVTVVLATPQAMLALALMMSVGLAAFRWLYNLTLHERGTIYADQLHN
jgi:hypothetical protein